MNSPLRDDGQGNYLVHKRNVYVSAALVASIVVGAVFIAGYTVQRATSFEKTLDWNTNQVAQIISEQKSQGARIAQIEQTARLLEYRVDRLDRRARGSVDTPFSEKQDVEL